MPFPTSHTFAVAPAPAPTSAGLGALADALRARGASVVRTSPAAVAFSGGSFWDTSALHLVSDARIQWTNEGVGAPVTVRLEFGGLVGLMTIYLVLAGVALLVGALSGVIAWLRAGMLLGAIALAGFGAGYAWAVVAGRWAVRRALRDATGPERAG